MLYRFFRFAQKSAFLYEFIETRKFKQEFYISTQLSRIFMEFSHLNKAKHYKQKIHFFQ